MLYSGSLWEHFCIMYIDALSCPLGATQQALYLQGAEFGDCAHQAPPKPPCHGGRDGGVPTPGSKAAGTQDAYQATPGHP